MCHPCIHTRLFSDGNSPDVPQQETSLGVGNHKHANTYFPGPLWRSCLQKTGSINRLEHLKYYLET